jgi:hypothetical protein
MRRPSTQGESAVEGQQPGGDPDRAALEDLRERILALDAQMAQLTLQRQALVEQYGGTPVHRDPALLARLGDGFGVPSGGSGAVRDREVE